MFQHGKAHPQTPLLSLLINPAAPAGHSTPLYSQLCLFFLNLCTCSPLLLLLLNTPATTNLRFGKKWCKKGQETRQRWKAAGWMVVWEGVCLRLPLFDQCWRTLTSLMCIQLSCFSLCLSLDCFYWSSSVSFFPSLAVFISASILIENLFVSSSAHFSHFAFMSNRPESTEPR